MGTIVCGRCSGDQITQFKRLIFSKNINIFHHLKLEIALAILASNEWKIQFKQCSRTSVNENDCLIWFFTRDKCVCWLLYHIFFYIVVKRQILIFFLHDLSTQILSYPADQLRDEASSSVLSSSRAKDSKNKKTDKKVGKLLTLTILYI